MRIIKVKHGKRESAEKVPGFVYCGRAFGGFDESPLHNPYRIGADGTLPEVLAKFHAHLTATLTLCEWGPVHDAVSRLSHDSVLGCWCLNKAEAGKAPWACHCDVIASVWQETMRGKQ